MINKMTKGVIALLLGYGQTAYANVEIQVKPFSMLKVSSDVELHVACDSNQLATFTNVDHKDELTVVNHRDTMEVEYDDINFFGFLDIDYARGQINTTPHRIKQIIVDKGARVTVDACAINTDTLNVNVAMGGTLDIKGTVKKLNLNAGMGAIFNGDSYRDFTADYVRAEVGMGGSAYLCGVKDIEGSARMGGFININKSANINIYEYMGGAYRTHDYYVKCE